MPFSTTALATTLLSGSPSWFANGVGDATLQAGNAPITPRDPTTLTLAIIGVGTLTLYFVARRRMQRRDESLKSYRFIEIERSSGGEEDKPSRGAA